MSQEHDEEQKIEETPQEDEIRPSDLMGEELRRAQAEAKEFKDKYYRTLADTENARKRLAQEKKEHIAYAIDNMLSEFLTPLDNLENALAYTDNLSSELKNWAEGFKMIAAQFRQVLEDHGVVPYTSVGHPFDAHLHEAIEMVESDAHKPGTIIQEIIKGYKHGDKILRVAKVKIATKANSNAKEGE